MLREPGNSIDPVGFSNNKRDFVVESKLQNRMIDLLVQHPVDERNPAITSLYLRYPVVYDGFHTCQVVIAGFLNHQQVDLLVQHPQLDLNTSTLLESLLLRMFFGCFNDPSEEICVKKLHRL